MQLVKKTKESRRERSHLGGHEKTVTSEGISLNIAPIAGILAVLLAVVFTIYPPGFFWLITQAPLIALVLLVFFGLALLDVLDIKGRDMLALCMRLQTLHDYVIMTSQAKSVTTAQRSRKSANKAALTPPIVHDKAKLPPKAKKIAQAIERNMIWAKVLGETKTPIGTTINLQIRDETAIPALKQLEMTLPYELGSDSIALDINAARRRAFIIVRDNHQPIQVNQLRPPDPKGKLYNFGILSTDGSELRQQIGVSTLPHLAVAGTTGYGKSVFVRYLISQIVRFGDPRHHRLLLVDPKNEDLGIFGCAPQLLCPVIYRPEEALKALRWLHAEMLNRQNHKQYSVPGQLFVVLEEWGNLGLNKEIQGIVLELLRQSRSAAITLILVMQRPTEDNCTPELKSLIAGRIAFKTGDAGSSRVFINSKNAANLPQGTGIFSFDGKEQEFRCPLIEKEQALKLANKMAKEYQSQHIKELAQLGQSSGNQSIPDDEDHRFYQWLIQENVERLSLKMIREQFQCSRRQSEKKMNQFAALGFVTINNGRASVVHPDQIQNYLGSLA